MAEGGKKDESKSPFSNPVFKKISLKNGEINKMTLADLKRLAKKLKIGGEGSTEILRKRLKLYYRKKFLNDAALMPKKPYSYYVVIDFEATCEDNKSPKTNFVHEIIEFPAVIVNSDTLAVEDVFHEYVRPVVNKTLSDYCISLTGISQSQVDSADTFPHVLERFMAWLQQHNLIGRSAVVTDGPWDMARFLFSQVKLCKLPFPKFAKQWVNIKKTFANFYNQRKPSLDIMLQQLHFEFEGRRHSGIDDSFNIAKVLIQMLKDGACVYINEKIDLSTFHSHAQRPIAEIVKPVKECDIPWNLGEGSQENCGNLVEVEEDTSIKGISDQKNQETCQQNRNDGKYHEEDTLSASLEQSTRAVASLHLSETRSAIQ